MKTSKPDQDLIKTQEEVVGEELVGGTVAMPEQNVTDELAEAVGIEMPDQSSLKVKDMLEERDNNRWELDPESAEDYDDHLK